MARENIVGYSGILEADFAQIGSQTTDEEKNCLNGL
jgi:hypothetical protein